VTGYSDIKVILDAAIDGDDIGAHGAFWRQRTRDQFVRHRVFGQLLIARNGNDFDAENSALIKAIEGRSPFGLDTGTPDARYNRMPSRRPPVAPDKVQIIKDWIKNGCPE
jgi:hypothetical protein